MVIWIGKPLAIAIHDRQLAEHGGSSGLRDDGLLESALARPQQLHVYGDPPPDLADLAASLAFGLARNHPFVDGNKRTAAVVCETFLNLNGATLIAEDAELFPVFLDLAEGKMPAETFAIWLRPRLQTDTPDSVQESRKRYAAR
ncbi:type II toxin-antitoxin system death-on-curing family toxin [Sinimarinibacterium flocculans]|uniref:type II toxin-antitoxin system death-on-curing family toxin n=1 Tax=Sinimarinibacterium flocculans TaxID=985250 RepID=UPI0035195A44